MHAFHTIVVGIDPQATSGARLRMAAALVRESAEVVSPVPGVRVILASCVADETHVAATTALLQMLADSVGIKAELRTLVGAAPDVLPAVCRETEADLLLLGARPPSHPFRSRFGPTACSLARKSAVPTLLLRLGRIGLEETVAASDDLQSDNALERLHLATEWALRRHAGLLAIHAVSADEVVLDSIEGCESQLFDRLAETDFRSIAGGVIPHVDRGSLAQVVDDAVRRFDVDLLVIGRDCEVTLENLLPQLDCSLLVVPDQANTPADANA